jgi:hypothetical protein
MRRSQEESRGRGNKECLPFLHFYISGSIEEEETLADKKEEKRKVQKKKNDVA